MHILVTNLNEYTPTLSKQFLCYHESVAQIG
jgi:hypothetical protein